jgi:long-chain acyl-CoA synthetase
MPTMPRAARQQSGLLDLPAELLTDLRVFDREVERSRRFQSPLGLVGEVLMRGPHVFRGYWRDEEASNRALEGGWLHSGDLGELDDEGYLTVTGRKKEIIVTSSGKNVAPAPIENALRRSRWISQAVVYGDRHPYLVALIALDQGELPELARRVGADLSPEALSADESVRAQIQEAVDEANRQFARIEQVKRFAILHRDLLQEEGELTPTLKVRRNVVYERHRATFDQLYESPERDAAASRAGLAG